MHVEFYFCPTHALGYLLMDDDYSSDFNEELSEVERIFPYSKSFMNSCTDHDLLSHPASVKHFVVDSNDFSTRSPNTLAVMKESINQSKGLMTVC